MIWQALMDFLARLRGSSPYRRVIPQQPLDFTVDESAVGFVGNFPVNRIYGVYSGKSAQGSSTFDLSIIVNFTGYFSGPSNPVASHLIGGLGSSAQGYGLYATVVASGHISGSSGPPDTRVMTFTRAEGHVFLDPRLDTNKTLPATAGSPVLLNSAGDDLGVLSATNIVPSQSQGILGTSFGGAFQIVFRDPAVAVPAGAAYWPGLPRVGLRVLIQGQINDTDLSGGTVGGSLSLAFLALPSSSDLYPG
jgi:hypothetical protein